MEVSIFRRFYLAEISTTVVPSLFSRPCAPQFMTTLWFHSNNGRASGDNRIIQRLVVSTFQSYLTIVSLPSVASCQSPRPCNSPIAIPSSNEGGSTRTVCMSKLKRYGSLLFHV